MENEITHSDTIDVLESKIVKLLENARSQVVSHINMTMVYTNFEIGRYIVEYEQNGNDRAEYGKSILKNLSNRLTSRFGKGYSEDNLGNMRKFYLCYSSEISETPSRKFTLSWSHYLKLMRIQNADERKFYEIEAAQNNWSFRELGRQVRLTFDEEHYYVDLVFYNRLLRAFVLIDLKRGKLKHQDLGQMQMYVNYYDRFVKLEDENPTVGILLCADKTDSVVEITLPKDNTQIFASKYQTVLPSKEVLKKLLQEKLMEN